MSAPFTIDATNWQLKAEELRLAFSERHREFSGKYKKFIWGGSSYQWSNGDGTQDDRLRGGENIQTGLFWSEMQSIVGDYVFPLGPIKKGGNKADFDARAISTADEFFAYAGEGLYDSETGDKGFRRVTSFDGPGNPIFQRGVMQVGDYIGEWIIDDLKTAFSAAKFRGTFLGDTEVESVLSSGQGSSDGYDLVQTFFAAAPPWRPSILSVDTATIRAQEYPLARQAAIDDVSDFSSTSPFNIYQAGCTIRRDDAWFVKVPPPVFPVPGDTRTLSNISRASINLKTSKSLIVADDSPFGVSLDIYDTADIFAGSPLADLGIPEPVGTRVYIASEAGHVYGFTDVNSVYPTPAATDDDELVGGSSGLEYIIEINFTNA